MSTRDDLVDTMERFVDDVVSLERVADAVLALLAERGMVVLGPDGEPLDVRPALRAFGALAAEESRNPRDWLMAEGSYYSLDGPLADACLAAAEVEP